MTAECGMRSAESGTSSPQGTNGHFEWRDPATMRAHPLTEHLHTYADDAEPFLRIVASMQRHGYDTSEPLVIDNKDRVVEGRHRLRAAKRLQIARVPVVVVEDDELASVIIRSICARKHFSKSAIAYECYPLFEEAHRAAVAEHERFLRKGPISPSVAQQRTGLPAPRFVEDLAKEMGVSPYTFKMAARVHELFRKEPEYAEQMIPRLYGEFDGGEHESTRPPGLGAILAGFSGKKRTEGLTKRQAEQLDLFGKAVKRFVFQAARIDVEDSESSADVIRAELETKAPEELERIAALAALVEAEAKRARKKISLAT